MSGEATLVAVTVGYAACLVVLALAAAWRQR